MQLVYSRMLHGDTLALTFAQHVAPATATAARTCSSRFRRFRLVRVDRLRSRPGIRAQVPAAPGRAARFPPGAGSGARRVVMTPGSTRRTTPRMLGSAAERADAKKSSASR